MISLIDIFKILRAGNTPTEKDWRDIMSSIFHKSERLPLTQVLGLSDSLKSKADNTRVEGLEKNVATKADAVRVQNIENTLPTLATKDDLLSVMEGLNPMGDALNMADLNTKPKRHKDSYFVLDQLDENENPYIFKYDEGVADWINTKQVVYKDVARKSEVVLKPIFENFSEKCTTINESDIVLLASQFSNHTLDSNGKPIANSARLLSEYLLVGKTLEIRASVNSEWNLIINLFDKDKRRIISTGDWAQTGFIYCVGAYYYAIQIMRKDKSEIVPNDSDSASLIISVNFSEEVTPAAPYFDFQSLSDKCFEISNLSISFKTSDFTQQNLDSDNKPIQSYVRILSKLISTSKAKRITASVSVGYQVFIDIYDSSGTWIRRPTLTWYQDVNWKLKENDAYFRVRVLKTDGTNITPDKWANAGLVVKLIEASNGFAPAAPYNDFKTMYEGFDSLSESCVKLSYSDIDISEVTYTNHTLDGQGKPIVDPIKLLSEDLLVGKALEIKASVNSAYELIINTFDDEKGKLIQSGDWSRSGSVVSKGAYFFKIRIIRSDRAEILPSEISETDLKVSIGVADGYSPALPYNAIFGSGSSQYVGEKINLKQTIFNHSVTLWKSFPQEETNYLGSSIAIYDNYLFEIEEGVRMKVVNMISKEVVAVFTMDIPTYNHANNANFSNISYDANDVYPLLFISRCDKTGGRECLIYRIQNNSGVWTGTHINSIFTDLNPNNWGDSWTIDNEHGLLFHYITLYGDYMVKDGNKCRMTGWKLPSREDIISGNNITLLGKDAIISFDFDYCVLQGACVNNGLIYLQAHNGGNPTQYPAGIWVFDPILGRRVSIIPHQQKEPEGIAISNGKLYWHGRTSNTTTDTPVTIYEYEF